jgi:hypothetical protein
VEAVEDRERGRQRSNASRCQLWGARSSSASVGPQLPGL